MTTDQIFGQKGKVWYQEQQDIVSSSSWKKRIRKRKFYPFFCFVHLMLTQTDFIFFKYNE